MQTLIRNSRSKLNSSVGHTFPTMFVNRESRKITQAFPDSRILCHPDFTFHIKNAEVIFPRSQAIESWERAPTVDPWRSFHYAGNMSSIAIDLSLVFEANCGLVCNLCYPEAYIKRFIKALERLPSLKTATLIIRSHFDKEILKADVKSDTRAAWLPRLKATDLCSAVMVAKTASSEGERVSYDMSRVSRNSLAFREGVQVKKAIEKCLRDAELGLNQEESYLPRGFTVSLRRWDFDSWKPESSLKSPQNQQRGIYRVARGLDCEDIDCITTGLAGL